MNWSGSVAIITGASRGIGRAVATAAADRGARVGLIARSKTDLDGTLAACGGRGALAVADVADRASLEQAIAALTRELGPPDILVNNAGIGAHGTVVDTDVEVFERLVRVNYLGTVWATKTVLPAMVERRRGHIVNIGSIAGRIGAPLEAGYSASKFAVAGFTEALAMELHHHGVGVSMIDPGPVETSFFAARGVPYQRKIPRPVRPDTVARDVIRAVERNRLELFVPRWLRFAHFIKVAVPPAYRVGTLRDYGESLR